MIHLPAPKGLFPPEPEHYRGPKLKVAIIGAGLAGMSTAAELLDQGHEVWLILFSCPQMLTICLLCFL
jgi:NADPH-dependent 2,4-dienoyl-CoA reductase/sulfur reductase-like enzyme